MLKPRDLAPGAATRTFLEAMRAGRLHLGRFVLDALDGTLVDCRAEGGRTPLMWAVLLHEPASRLAFAQLLLERGASVDLRDDAGRSALSLACERGHLDVARLLVQHGADPDATDARGWSPLMHAAAAGRAPLLEWLLHAFRRLGQLRLERADRTGRTALQLATDAGHGRCVRALRAAGAPIFDLPDRPAGSAAAAPPSPRPAPPSPRPAAPPPDPAPPPPRVRPLIRRATAPDCQSLLGC